MFKKFLEKKGISADQFKDLDAEKQMELQNEYLGEIESQVGKAATKEEVLSSIKDELKKLSDGAIKEIAEDVTAIQEKMKVGNSDDIKGTLKEVLKDSYDAIKEAFKNNTPLKDIVIVKAPAMHMTNNGTVSNVEGLGFPNSTFEVDNEIAYIRLPENFILRVIRNTQREKVPAQMLKMQQVAGEGSAAVTVEGAVKPLIQKKFQRTSTARKKHAGRIEWTEEFEMDFEALLDAIIDMLERDVITDWQDGLLEVIDANATAYLGSTLDDTLVNPDNGLAVIAVAQQIRNLGFTPNYAIMNPGDIDASVYTQDVNGNFSLKPYIDASGNKIGGITLIPSLKMDEGEALVGDFSIYKEVHSRVILRKGQYNAQFIENEYTMIGEVFSIMNAAPAEYPAIVKVNLATVKAALLKPVTP